MPYIIITILLLLIPLDSHSQVRDVVFLEEKGGFLPVELEYFYGELHSDSVFLYWGTATEVNNYGFQVQRSVDSLNWSNIGFVLGAGTSNSPKDYSFIDGTLPDSNVLYYRLQQIDNGGGAEYSWVVRIEIVTTIYEELLIPSAEILYQNYPNPFNPETTIKFNLSERTTVDIIVFNTAGEEVVSIFEGELNNGAHNFLFDGSSLSSGIYYLRLRTESNVFFLKMLLLK